MSFLLEVSNLRIRLQTHRGPADAVRGVSFSLARGETLGLIGESGCGKSITAMSLMGLLPDSAQVTGSIRFDGQELVGRTDAQMCQMRGNRIGMVFQEPMTALNPVMSCGDQVDELLRTHTDWPAAKRRQAVLDIFARVKLPDPERMVRSFPHQLSGGQRQRIVIAMAVILKPALLICDEPTTALDVTTQIEVLAAIKEAIHDTGVAALYITHDLAVVAQVADDILVLQQIRNPEDVERGVEVFMGAAPSRRQKRGG